MIKSLLYIQQKKVFSQNNILWNNILKLIFSIRIEKIKILRKFTRRNKLTFIVFQHFILKQSAVLLKCEPPWNVQICIKQFGWKIYYFSMCILEFQIIIIFKANAALYHYNICNEDNFGLRHTFWVMNMLRIKSL